MSNKRKYLVYGYIRKQCIHDMAKVLINICYSFFNDELVWNFKKDKLSHLLSMKHGQCIKSKEITYNNDDISLQYELYPNGKKWKYRGYVQFYLFVTKMNYKYVDHVTIGFTLCCDETKTILNTLSRYYNPNCGNGWMNQLRLSKCKKYKKLTFRCCINSLQIKYKNKTEHNQLKTQFSYLSYKPLFKTTLNLKWNVHKSLLKQFIKCKNGERFCSPQFNNWSFDVKVFEDELKICLVLIRWPSCCVTKMKVKCMITEQINNIKIETAQEYIHCFEISKSQNGLYFDCNKNKIPTFLLNTYDTFILTANIQVLEMFDKYNNIIPMNQWHMHHFNIDMVSTPIIRNHNYRNQVNRWFNPFASNNLPDSVPNTPTIPLIRQFRNIV
eukprot:392713_1